MNLEIKFPVHEIWGDAFKPYPAQKYPGQNGRAPEIITYFQLPRSVELFQPPERTWTDRDLSMWCGLTSSSWAGACRHWTLSIRSTPRAMFSRHVHYLVSLTRKYGVHNQLGSPKYSNRYLVCTCHVPDTGYFVSFCCCDKHHDQEQLGGGGVIWLILPGHSVPLREVRAGTGLGSWGCWLLTPAQLCQLWVVIFFYRTELLPRKLCLSQWPGPFYINESNQSNSSRLGP